MAAPARNDDLAVGVDILDLAHARLIDQLRQIDEALATGRMRTAVRQLHLFLTDFDKHFETENELLAQLGFDGLSRRRGEYRTSQALFTSLHLDADDVELVTQVAVHARAWLLDHIVNQDMPLKPFLMAHGIGEPTRRRLWRRYDMIKLRWRIALLAFVPMVVLVGLAVAAWGELRDRTAAMTLLHEMNRLNGVVGTLVHELQRERGLAVLHIANPRMDRGGLRLQLERSDRAINDFNHATAELAGKLPDGPARTAIANAKAGLDLVPEVRSDVGSSSFDAVETMDFYTTAIHDLAAVVPEVVRTVLPTDFAKTTFAYVFLMEAKERAGRERAVGAAMLAGGLPLREFGDIRRLAAEQDALADGFESLAPPDLAQAFRQARDTLSGQLGAMRRTIESGESTGLTANDWFAATTERIDRMRDVETDVMGRLATDVAALEERTLSRAILVGGCLAGLIVLSFAMVGVLGWTILPPLRRIGLAMRRLAEGERTVRVPGLSDGDELGDIARFAQLLKERLVRNDLLEARRWTENAERLRAVTDNLPGVVFRVLQPNHGGPIIACASRKLREVAGIAAADVVDMPLRTLLRRLVAPDDRRGLFHALYRAGFRPVEFEFKLRAASEERPRWLRVTATPLQTEAGWVWDGVVLDITGLKRMEDERTEISAQLHTLSRLHAQSELASRFGGELEAALQPILAHGAAATRQLPPGSPVREDMDAIVAAAEEIRNLSGRMAAMGGGGAASAQPPSPENVIDIREALKCRNPQA